MVISCVVQYRREILSETRWHSANCWRRSLDLLDSAKRVTKNAASNIVVASIITLFIGLIIANGWLDEFHAFVGRKTGHPIAGPTLPGAKFNLRFVAGIVGLWLMLQFLIEFGAEELAASLAGLIVLSFGLVYGERIFGSISANLKG